MAYTLGLHKETLEILRNRRRDNKNVKAIEAEHAFEKRITELHTESQQHRTEEAFLTAMLSHAVVFLFKEAVSNINKETGEIINESNR